MTLWYTTKPFPPSVCAPHLSPRQHRFSHFLLIHRPSYISQIFIRKIERSFLAQQYPVIKILVGHNGNAGETFSPVQPQLLQCGLEQTFYMKWPFTAELKNWEKYCKSLVNKACMLVWYSHSGKLCFY